VGQAFGPKQQGNSPNFESKPKNFLSKSRRIQIDATLEAALKTRREALFEFTGGIPHPEVIHFIERHAVRMNVPYKIVVN
ncbi:MAG: hypothetical protein HC794_01405, partial [Nitrospiraceae bacterium]|nr:hypothetical protein [Nitrospiraceae bacterium]